MCPGDEFYAQPYVYVNPWPRFEGRLPDLPVPGRWHTDGFLGVVITGEDILAFEDAGGAAFVYRRRVSRSCARVWAPELRPGADMPRIAFPLALIFSAHIAAALAQTYPSRPPRLIVGFTPAAGSISMRAC